MSHLVLRAPLSGWVAPLAETPDPVFAQGMMGEGVAIDPISGTLCAPCAGTIVKAHAAGHAVSLRTAEGAEILMHIGIDTVALGGVGFEVHVQDGQSVAAGDRLVSFDLDLLSQRARSLITPVLVTNPERFRTLILRTGCEIAVGEPLLELVAADAVESRQTGGTTRIRRAQITHPHGLHARPSALLASQAKRWTAQLEIILGDRRADLRSPVSVMSLGVQGGDEVEIGATGEDADAALEALLRVVDEINAAPVAAEQPVAASPAAAEIAGVLQGVAAAPGLAVGPAWRRKVAAAPVSEAAHGEAQEMSALQDALAEVRGQMQARLAHLAGETRSVVEAHLELLDDPALLAAARTRIVEGASAGVAVRDAAEILIAALRALSDPRLAERALDLRDLQQQLLWAISGRQPDRPAPPPGAILIAEDLLPSDLVGFADAALAGVCTARGGPTSHVAIIAQGMDIPCVVAVGPRALQTADGATVILDGGLGRLETAPTPERTLEAESQVALRRQAKATALAASAASSLTRDGARIAVLANVGALGDALTGARNGAEGCGLLRTEFLFLEREQPPSEDEQFSQYQAIAEALPGLPVTIRTLDVGGDKPAPYLRLPAEENPALGLRGVRISLAQPDLFRVQLRAILRVRPAGQCRIMVPMVASLTEILAVRRLLEAEAKALGAALPALGIMVETPAAATTADLFAAEVDFLSIGTNDLAQYTLAMDRGDPNLAPSVDALHPAVLRLIRMTVEAADRFAKPVSVCGGLASDPAAAPILIGLGVRQLSVAPGRAAEIKALIRTLDLKACQALALEACGQASAAEVRALQIRAPGARRVRKGASA
jgi:phosphoenolpyruvate-protein phosphotransferase